MCQDVTAPREDVADDVLADEEADGATWHAEDEYDSEESEAAAVFRGSRPGG